MYTVHVQVHVHREERIFVYIFVNFFYCKQLLVYGLMGGGGIPEAQDSLLGVLRCPQS